MNTKQISLGIARPAILALALIAPPGCALHFTWEVIAEKKLTAAYGKDNPYNSGGVPIEGVFGAVIATPFALVIDVLLFPYQIIKKNPPYGDNREAWPPSKPHVF